MVHVRWRLVFCWVFFFPPLFFLPSPLASFCAAQHFCCLLTFSLPLWHISVILRPITAALAYITVSLPSFFIPSFLPSYTRSPSPVRALFPPRTHTSGCTLSRCPVTQDVVISLGAQFALNVPNERFPTLPFPGRRPLPPLPFSLYSALPS